MERLSTATDEVSMPYGTVRSRKHWQSNKKVINEPQIGLHLNNPSATQMIVSLLKNNCRLRQYVLSFT
jgi:hypothetical protein